MKIINDKDKVEVDMTLGEAIILILIITACLFVFHSTVCGGY